MPVSHIGLTVSHLPTSTSFFLSALQPLGYRFIGQQGNQIGLGIRDADFFLCQETPGVKAGAAHIAFTAPSRIAVREFYTAALTAGGRPNGAPASRTEDCDHFNAAVLDFDGNSVEVVFRNEPDIRDDGTVIEHSRVLTWQKSVAESIQDDRSVVSSRTSTSKRKQALLPAATTVLSNATSVISKATTMARSVSEPFAVPQAPVSATVPSTSNGDGAAKKIIGTLLGAAAGAAVAYAMCKSEEDSAKKEAEFDAFLRARAIAEAEAKELSRSQHPKLSMQDPLPIYEAPPKSIHRNISDTDSHYSTSEHRLRAIEAPPRSYHSPTYVTVPPTQFLDRPAIEYAPPAYSVAPSRTQFSVQRSFTSPEMTTVSKARSMAPSVAPSTLISSFVPEQAQRRTSEGSVASHRSHSSKARPSHSHVSKHSSRSSSRVSSSPTPAKAASIVGSILGRDASSSISKKDSVDELEIEDLDINDSDTVAPSDSISNAGSRRSHRSHRSSSRVGSSASKHSHSSKRSHRSHRTHSNDSHHSSSKSSHHSHHSSRHHREESPLSQEWHDASESRSVSKPSVLSEPSDASTVKPSRPKADRKDSVTQYDVMFNSGNRGERWGHGAGTMVSLPIRGITPSMIEEARSGRKGKRSVASYTMGQTS